MALSLVSYARAIPSQVQRLAHRCAQSSHVGAGVLGRNDPLLDRAAVRVDCHDLLELLEQHAALRRIESPGFRQLLTPLEGVDILPDTTATLFAQGFEPGFQSVSFEVLQSRCLVSGSRRL